jgi:hypothetical protein
MKMNIISYLKFIINRGYKSFGMKRSGTVSQMVLSIAFLWIGFAGSAQVTTKIDTTKIRIGEQFHYDIIVNGTEDILFTKFQSDSLRKVEVIESKVDSLKNSLIKKYALTSFDSGRWVLPPQKVMIRNKAFLTDSIIIDVATVAVDTIKQPMYHIKDIQNEPYTFADYKNYIWGLLALLLLIAIILYFVLRKKPTEEEKIAKIPPFDLAKQRLKDLDDKKLIKHNRIKPYYVELTDIVRTFIEREMNIPALESTTDELMEIITDFNESSNLNIPDQTIVKLKQLLKEADLVKFAKSKPLLNEIELHRNYAENIIDKFHPDSVVEEKEEIKPEDHVGE